MCVRIQPKEQVDRRSNANQLEWTCNIYLIEDFYILCVLIYVGVGVLLVFSQYSLLNDYVLVTIEQDDVHIHKQNHTHNRQYPSTVSNRTRKMYFETASTQNSRERKFNDVKCSLIVGWILENPVELNKREAHHFHNVPQSTQCCCMTDVIYPPKPQRVFP